MTNPIKIKNKLADQSFKKPHFAVNVRTIQGEEISVADPQATRALVALMDMYAVLGGAASHYGGPAALAELMSALHGFVFHQASKKNKAWYDLFHIVNDAGHCENGLYALKANYEMAGLKLESLKKFRSIESGLTGHGEVHCFSEGVLLSNGPLGSAFPQTQGLAMAEKYSGEGRVTFCVISDGACMEGEAKEAFAAIPGLARAGQLAPYVLIISDNNTKLSGRIDKDSYSMRPTFESLNSLGWRVLTLEAGNHTQSCLEFIEKAVSLSLQDPTVPVVIHAKTIKGIGSKKTAESATGGHGFPLKSPTELPAFLREIYQGQDYPAIFNEWIEELVAWEKRIKESQILESGEKIQKGISSAMIKAKKEGHGIVSITSDLPGSTGVADFRKEFPRDSFDVGIAESNMISVAAGFSKMGYVPVVDTFAQFGVTKGALPLTMASLSEAPIIAVFSHTGFQDAADGASHQALSYFSMLSSIPHVKLISLSCSEEAEALMTLAIKNFSSARQQGQTPDSYVFFLGRENFPKSYGAPQYHLDQYQILRDEALEPLKSVTILTCGSLLGQALVASDLLKKNGYGAVVMNTSCMNQFDEKTMKEVLKKTQGRIITVEDHQLISGLGSFVAHQLSLHHISFQMKSLAVHGDFGQSAYNAIELYRKHKIDAESIHQAALRLF